MHEMFLELHNKTTLQHLQPKEPGACLITIQPSRFTPRIKIQQRNTFKQISGALDGPLPVFSREVLKRRECKSAIFQ